MKTFGKLYLVIVMLLLSAAILSACGGGGSSSSAPPTSATSSVSGVASKGLLSGATVTAYSLNASGIKGSALGSARTSANGSYSINLGSYTGAVILEASGGSYTDEATGATTINMVLLRAAVTNVSGTVQAAVTPLTEIAVRKAGTLTATNIDTANTLVSNMIGGTNIITTLPANVLVSSSSTTAAKNYGLALATISQMVSDGTASTVTNAISMIAADLADNTINTTGATISTSLNNFLASANNHSGLTSSNTPAAAAIASATTGTIRNNWNISGKFNTVMQIEGFEYQNTAAVSAIVSETVSAVFDGQGALSCQYANEVTYMNPSLNSISSIPDSGPCSNTYSMNSGGTFTFLLGPPSPYWLNVSGNTLLWGGYKSTEFGIGSTQGVAVKEGSGMTVSSVSGTYWWTTQTSGFYAYVPNGPSTPGGPLKASMVYADTGRITFDGAGLCSMTTITNINFDMLHNSNAIMPMTFTPMTSHPCTYTINSTGAITVSDASGILTTGKVSADGMAFISGGKYVNGSLIAADQMVAIKQTEGLTVSSVTGTYKCVDQELGFVKYTSSGNTASRSYVTTQTLHFDGAGNVVVSYDGYNDILAPATDTITSNPVSVSNIVGTYAIAGNGVVSLTFPGPVTYNTHPSADGSIALFGTVYNGIVYGSDTLYSVAQNICVKTQ